MNDATGPDAAPAGDAPQAPATLEHDDAPAEPAAAGPVLDTPADGRNDTGVLHGVSAETPREPDRPAAVLRRHLDTAAAALQDAEVVIFNTGRGVVNPDRLLKAQARVELVRHACAFWRGGSVEYTRGMENRDQWIEDVRAMDERCVRVASEINYRLRRWIEDAWLDLGAI